jgi:hypothetical protein
MGLLDYLKSWNPKGGSDEGENSDYGVPLRHDMPESPQWGYSDDKIGAGGFGHSSDCEDVGQKGATWGMSSSDVARGYEGPERYDSGIYEQDIPQTNVHDYGAGSAARAKEFKSTEGRGFDGVGNDKRNPGTQQIGSSSVKPGNQAD